MLDRAVGQRSLADDPVQREETEFDRVAGLVNWVALRTLLGPLSGPGSEQREGPAEVLPRCLLLGVWRCLLAACAYNLRRTLSALNPKPTHAGAGPCPKLA